jgi:hypothetical protein
MWRSRPQNLRILAGGYARYVDACNTQPTPEAQLSCRAGRLEAQYKHTVTLSDTLDYGTALQEAQEGLQTAQNALAGAQVQSQKDSYSTYITRFTGLVGYLQDKAPPQ